MKYLFIFAVACVILFSGMVYAETGSSSFIDTMENWQSSDEYIKELMDNADDLRYFRIQYLNYPAQYYDYTLHIAEIYHEIGRIYIARNNAEQAIYYLSQSSAYYRDLARMNPEISELYIRLLEYDLISAQLLIERSRD